VETVINDFMRLFVALTCALLIAAGAVHCAHADYALLLVQADGEIVTVERYQGDDETPCWEDYHAYRLGARRWPDVVNAYTGGCAPCDEFPAFCVEGI
jgi:hypothetical protein